MAEPVFYYSLITKHHIDRTSIFPKGSFLLNATTNIKKLLLNCQLMYRSHFNLTYYSKMFLTYRDSKITNVPTPWALWGYKIFLIHFCSLWLWYLKKWQVNVHPDLKFSYCVNKTVLSICSADRQATQGDYGPQYITIGGTVGSIDKYYLYKEHATYFSFFSLLLCLQINKLENLLTIVVSLKCSLILLNVCGWIVIPQC